MILLSLLSSTSSSSPSTKSSSESSEDDAALIRSGIAAIICSAKVNTLDDSWWSSSWMEPEPTHDTGSLIISLIIEPLWLWLDDANPKSSSESHIFVNRFVSIKDGS